ncbi:MAG: GntR family transcriptional regulator [Sarcina sp.]
MNFQNIEFNNSESIYLQIVEFVKRSIATGELKENEKLPSIREMSKDMKVNPNTMQRAYAELETLGITYTQRGKGSFISPIKNEVDLQMEMAKDISRKFLADMKGIGIPKKIAIDILEECD